MLDNKNLLTRTMTVGPTGWQSSEVIHIPSQLSVTMEGRIGDTSLQTLTSKARQLLDSKVKAWRERHGDEDQLQTAEATAGQAVTI